MICLNVLRVTAYLSVYIAAVYMLYIVTILFSPIFVRVGTEIIFRWYDLWVGVYIDRKNQVVYVFLLPCFGLSIPYSNDRGL